MEARIFALLPHNLCLHLIAGSIIFAASHRLGAAIAMALVLTAGVAKEVYDYFVPGHTCDWQGVFCTALGGILCLAATL